jgi:arylsulfatase B
MSIFKERTVQNRRSFFKGSACGIGLMALSRQVAAAGGKRPNVILILTDDHGYGEVGAHGNPLIRTPQLDRLHNEGVRLKNFHVNNVCSPSRAAIMTGKYSTHVGVWHTLGGRDMVYPDETMMPQVFADNGYKTLMVGKWHIGDSFPYRPEDRGFQEVRRIGGGSPGQVADHWENSLFDMHYWNGKNWKQSKGFCTDTQFDAAIDFIGRSADRPFFCYLSTTAVHSPIGAPDEYLALYEGRPKEVQAFYGMVSNLDWNIGRLRAFLKQNGLEENTILVFMTDNGTACDKKNQFNTFNGGMRGRKGSDYDGGHRVPCFVYWPAGGLPRGADVHPVTAHIDLLPTFVDACGLKSSVEADGTSILPLLRNPESAPLDRILVTEGKVGDRSQMFASSCVLSGAWRLVKGSELYNVAEDPGQENNVAGDNPEIVKRLRTAYEAWHAEMEKGFDKESRSVIGDPKANPARLYCMDLHALPKTGKKKNKGKTVWNQKAVKKGDTYHGVWKLEVAQPGTYEISLRRFPEESGLTFSDVPAKGSAVEYRQAELKIGKHRLSKPVDMASHKVTFSVDLSPGPAELDAVLIDADGRETSAYYVNVLRK